MAQDMGAGLTLKDNFMLQMQNAVEMFKQMSNASTGLNKQLEDMNAGEKLVAQMSSAKAVFQELSDATTQINKSLEKVGFGFAKDFNEEIDKATKVYESKVESLTKPMDMVSGSLKAYLPSVSDCIDQVSSKMKTLDPNAKALIGKGISSIPAIKDKGAAAAKSLASLADKTGIPGKVNETMGSIKAMIDKSGIPDKVNDKLSSIKNVLDKSGIPEKVGLAMDKIKEKAGALKDKAKLSPEASGALKDFGAAAFKQFSGNGDVKGIDVYKNGAEQLDKPMKAISNMALPFFPQLSEQVNQANDKIANLNPAFKELIGNSMALAPEMKKFADNSGLSAKVMSATAPIQKKAQDIGKKLNISQEKQAAIKNLGVAAVQQFSDPNAGTNTFESTAGAATKSLSTISDTLMPFFPNVSKNINTVTDKINNLSPNMKSLIGNGIALGPAIGEVLKGGLSLKKVTGAFTKLKGAMESARIGQMLLNAVMSINPVVIIVLAIGALIGVLIYLWNTNKNFRDAVIAIWNKIKLTFSNVIEGIKGYFNAFMTHIMKLPEYFESFKSKVYQHIQELRNKLGESLNNIKNSFVENFNKVKNGVMSIIQPFVNIVVNVFNGMKGGLTTMITGIKNIFTGYFNLIKTVVLGVILLICDIVSGKFGKLKSDALKIMQAIFNSLKQIWTGIWQVISGYVKALAGGIIAVFKNLKGIIMNVWNSISGSLFALWNKIVTYCKTAWNNMLNSISMILKNIGSFISNVWNGILYFFTTLPSKLYEHGVNIITNLKGGIVNTFVSVKNAIKDGIDGAVKYIKDLPAKFVEWGSDMINGLVKGIKNTISSVQNGAEEIANKIRSYLHFSRPDVGPLSDYETWMPDFMKGMSNGIKVNTKLVTDPIKDIGVGIKNNLGDNLSGKGGVINGKAYQRGNGQTVSISIPKLADTLIVREESDIDKIAEALVKKMKGVSLNMA